VPAAVRRQRVGSEPGVNPTARSGRARECATHRLKSQPCTGRVMAVRPRRPTSGQAISTITVLTQLRDLNALTNALTRPRQPITYQVAPLDRALHSKFVRSTPILTRSIFVSDAME
jgi:hypothetical protein